MFTTQVLPGPPTTVSNHVGTLNDCYDPCRFDPILHRDLSGSPLSSQAITLFETPGRQVKGFKLGDDGALCGLNYQPGFKGKARTYFIPDLVGLFHFLSWAEWQRNSMVMRGTPVTEKKKIVRRYKNEPITFTDTPRSWLCIDIDGLLVPPGLSYECPQELAEYAVCKLPTRHFSDVSFIWQLSSSAGIRQPDKIKLHLWFWLDEPLNCKPLRAWAKALKGLVDPALYNPVQPHITARPYFVGDLRDPFETRTHLAIKNKMVVHDAAWLEPPPAPKKAKRKLRARNTHWNMPPGTPLVRYGDSPFRNWESILHEVEREQHFHGPIYRLILSYFGSGGADIDELKTQLRIEIAKRNHSARVDVHDRYLTDEYLDAEIANAIAYLRCKN